jgi:hypothetical protein
VNAPKGALFYDCGGLYGDLGFEELDDGLYLLADIALHREGALELFDDIADDIADAAACGRGTGNVVYDRADLIAQLALDGKIAKPKPFPLNSY